MTGSNGRYMGLRKLSFVSVGSNGNGRTDLTFLSDLERSLSRAGMPSLSLPPFGIRAQMGRYLARAGIIRNFIRLGRKAYVIPVMQPSFGRFFPVSYAYETIPYCFDCWERHYPRFLHGFKRQRCRVAFFSARQSAEHFQKCHPRMESFWLPEACEPSDYLPDIPLDQRQTDVLEFGRRHAALHDMITGPLSAAGRTHLYSKSSRELIFPTFKSLHEGMGQSKISVCFPASVSNKEWGGNVETVTYRYFESIASKCLIYGHCPAELRDLFGYDPVVAADFDRPAEQLQEILRDISSFQELVDRNYQRLLEVGTWTMRVRQMTDILRERGYVPAEEART